MQSTPPPQPSQRFDMPATDAPRSRPSIFRVDRFVVPEAAEAVFIAQLRRVQRVLDTMPGCKQNLALIQTAGPGKFNVLTIVEWATQAAMAAAKLSMQAYYASEHFDPPAFMASLGVRADMATYAAAAD